MKRIVIIVFVFIFADLYATAQLPPSGKVEFGMVPSKILSENRNFSIYLPQSYKVNSEKYYPVLYLLHGGGDTNIGWVRRGHLEEAANQIFNSGFAKEMIIVIPDAGTTFMNYFNSDGWRYEDFFFEEFIAFIESNYRVKSSKKYRAIGGLSMGGGGSIAYAQRHPEMFSSVYAMSG